MYPANKEMDAGHSGTGIYYQAIPAVGADGKNIMKLIPVQMVNRQFCQADASKRKTDSTPQKCGTMSVASAPVQTVKKSALNPFDTQQIFRKQVSSVNSLSRPVELDHRYSLNTHTLQRRTERKLAAKVLPIAIPPANCGESVRHPCQLPVTVTSPALPKGQCILIPPNAQVQTVPASDLPPRIKKQIFISPDNSSSGSSVPSVVYVSPVTTINQSATPPNDSAVDSFRLFSETSSNTLCGSQSKGSKPHLKLIPKVSQRPNSPIKWVIEEEDSSTAPYMNPPNSSTVTSEILQAVAMRETVDKHCDFIQKSPSAVSDISQAIAGREAPHKQCHFPEQSPSVTDIVRAVAEGETLSKHSDISQSINLGKAGQGRENALVMCNGKVFFLAKKCNKPLKTGQSDPLTSATKSYEFNRTTVPSSQPSAEPVEAQTQQDLRIIIPDDSDDVIDLCDDDDSTQSVDEDNVIFVSYIPPKSQVQAFEKDMVQVVTNRSNSLTDKNQLEGRTGNDDGVEGSAVKGKPGQTTLVSTVRKSVCGSAVINMPEDSNVKGQQSVSTQQVESMDVDVAAESPAGPSASSSSIGTCSQKERATHKIEILPNSTTCTTSSLAPKPCPMADHLLRKTFGITADVNICLQRIDETSAWSVPAQSLHNKSIRSVEGHFPADPANPTPHKDVTLTGQSSLCGTSCDVECTPVIDYVEPIDEDFPSTNEDDIPKSQTCLELNTNTSRIGRTRKRTMCPCCSTGALVHAVKSSARSEEAEKWTTEQMRKNDGRTKLPGKDGKTAGKISWVAARSKQKCKTSEVPASVSLTATSTDFDKLKYVEQIAKLRDLLKDKQADKK